MILQCIFFFILLLFFPPTPEAVSQQEPGAEPSEYYTNMPVWWLEGDCGADYAASKSRRVLVEEAEGSRGRPLSRREQNEKPNLCSRSSRSCWIIASRLNLLNFYPSLFFP